MRLVPRVDHPHFHPVDRSLRPADRFATCGASPLAKKVERGLELARGVDSFDVHESPLTRITNFAGRLVKLLADDGFEIEPLGLCE